MALDFAVLDNLAAALVAAGIRSASVNPADVLLPGVWIQVAGVELDLLAGHTIGLNLVAITGDTGPARSMADLAETFNKVVTVIDPTGQSRMVSVTLPGNPPLPGLSIPFDLPICDDL